MRFEDAEEGVSVVDEEGAEVDGRAEAMIEEMTEIIEEIAMTVVTGIEIITEIVMTDGKEAMMTGGNEIVTTDEKEAMTTAESGTTMTDEKEIVMINKKGNDKTRGTATMIRRWIEMKIERNVVVNIEKRKKIANINEGKSVLRGDMNGTIGMKKQIMMAGVIVDAVVGTKTERRIMTRGDEIIIGAMTAGQRMTKDVAKMTTDHVSEMMKTNILIETATIKRPKKTRVARTILNLPHPVSLALAVVDLPLNLRRIQGLLPDTVITAIIPLPLLLPIVAVPRLAHLLPVLGMQIDTFLPTVPQRLLLRA